MFQNLIKVQQLKLERIQHKALKLILGLKMFSPSNFVLMESKEPTLSNQIELSLQKLSRLSRVLAQSDHHLILPTLEEMLRIKENPTIICRVAPSVIFNNYSDLSRISHLIEKDLRPLCYVNSFDSIMFFLEVNLSTGIIFDKESRNNEIIFKEIFQI